MKALAYEKAHALDAFAIDLVEVDEPRLRDRDLLVEVHAIGINPGEAAIRRTRGAEPGGRVVLGWEFAGVVVEAGSVATGFAIGDRVLGTGDITRDGSWAERVAVDHRVVAKIPDRLAFTDAASLPVGVLTAWESLFRDEDTLLPGVGRVLVIGGAGGVGSMATQLLKATTPAFVISTASRPESRKWAAEMGADLVVDHRGDLAGQLRTAGIDHVDLVFSTAGTSGHLGAIVEVLRPFGHLAAVDLAGPFDTAAFTGKSLSLHSEMVFSKIVAGGDVASQGRILSRAADDVAAGLLRPIVTTTLDGLTAETMKTAHTLVESGRTIGKTVVRVTA
ncbi:Bifunctional protein: zinc-containing alcohol dehydrogenase / quinone oxidoreductase (NADPH:quinone reductase) (EC / Similar to arginate lyase [Amycolatopsis camponoti]|uniref:Zinc-type alcohol dehydrogenase-like protein n=1 Tax=Amycolatopsis camponoti TaxID=2606593 RepID=A0A6I8LZF0_9PSEU|nr:zinc-binding alcohol dehydrogenase family protein [Amycolatopsis camponoti]VVJ21950.1 Bifunctional protein: zinc-containing alcohol dehydrogenase / quinone oxidoreductase (NADPH:quinone reductase) (EC / Similar to arginate lyase [Amycolatopsis camponoti]